MNPDTLWKIHDGYIDLYKFHWDISIKLVALSLGIAGAISTYVLQHSNQPLMAFALLVPFLLCCFIAWLAHVSEPGLKLAQDEVRKAATDLEMPTHANFASLLRFMYVSKFLNGGIALVLGALAIYLQFPR